MLRGVRNVWLSFLAVIWCVFASPTHAQDSRAQTQAPIQAQGESYSSQNLIPDILFWRTDETFRDPVKALEYSVEFHERRGTKFQKGKHVWLWWQVPAGFTSAEGKSLLLGRYFNASNIDLFWQTADGEWKHRAYDSKGGHDEIVIGEQAILTFPEPIHQAKQVMIRLDRPLTIATLSNIRFISEADLNKNQNTLRIFFGVLFGIVFAMFGYNLMLYFALRMRVQLFYLTYSAGVLLYTWSASSLYGPMKPYLTGITPLYFPYVTLSVMGWGMFMFVSHIVDRKYFPQSITRIFEWCAHFMLAITALGVVLDPLYFPTIIMVRDLTGAAGILLFFVVGTAATLKGSRTSPLLMFALIFPATASVVTLVWSTNGQAMPFWVDHALVMSFAIENILLAAVIADRIRHIRLERDEARRQQEELAQKANTDFLTKVYNRRFIVDYGKALFGAANGREDVAVVMVDLDRFKYVNDTYGHDVGDEVLAMTANVCAENLRPDDVIGRFGGEEFLIILPRTDPKTAHRVSERLRRAIHSVPLPGLSALGAKHISASFGIATGKTGVSNMNELIKRSDEALLQAKERGRDQVVTWDPFG